MFRPGGKPEFAVGAGDGHVFFNVEDKSEIAEIDAQKLTITHRWPLAPCKEPSGLAMDAENHRLFAVCDNNVMAVVNAATGKVIATPKIGDDPDAAGFDPELHLAFSSNGGPERLPSSARIPPKSSRWWKKCPRKNMLAPWPLTSGLTTFFFPSLSLGQLRLPGSGARP